MWSKTTGTRTFRSLQRIPERIRSRSYMYVPTFPNGRRCENYVVKREPIAMIALRELNINARFWWFDPVFITGRVWDWGRILTNPNVCTGVGPSRTTPVEHTINAKFWWIDPVFITGRVRDILRSRSNSNKSLTCNRCKLETALVESIKVQLPTRESRASTAMRKRCFFV